VYLTINVPSAVAFDVPMAPSESSAWVAFPVREVITAPVFALVQGTSLPIARSIGNGPKIDGRTRATECTTFVPTASDLPYPTQQATKGAVKGVRPGVRSWSPPD